ncbi:hypothetical protein Moror_1722 [Moniliophthora roreri MCA 2997]|uniref:Uncharacterized protein n=2 Tax=Moniliophthora roreri TaxID=221103 RepID=V2XKR4_MONRO|nr:hypothetical protein Moror_1722 [Moniliophthora roreri MCA 2997]
MPQLSLKANRTRSSVGTKPHPIAHISRLPNEVLGIIFTFCVQLTLQCASTSNRPWRCRTWIWVSHVCRHWRSVALSCTGMWTKPDFGIPALAKEMLIRAKSAPLRIDAHLQRHPSPSPAYHSLNLVEEALQDISRVSELRITAEIDILEKLFSGQLQQAPLLSTLDIRALELDDDLYFLPDNLFGGEAPRLRELTLMGCRFRSDYLFLSKLRSITMHSHRSANSPLPKEFIQALQRMPDLERLDLEGNLPLGSSIPDVVVTLPRLRSVRLSGTLENSVGLLGCLNIPITTSISLEGFAEEPGTLDSLARCLFHFFPLSLPSGSSSRIVKALTLESTRRNDGARFALTASDYAGQSMYGPSFTLRLEEALYPVSDLSADIIAHVVLGVLPLSHLRDLHLSVNAFTAKHYTKYFGTLSGLETIRVRGNGARGLAASLSESKNVYPSLKKLVFWDVDYQSDSIFFITLVASLRFRLEQGRPLEKLEIKEAFNFSKNQRNMLRPVVLELDWDGMVRTAEFEMDLEDESDGLSQENDSDEYYHDDDD